MSENTPDGAGRSGPFTFTSQSRLQSQASALGFQLDESTNNTISLLETQLQEAQSEIQRQEERANLAEGKFHKKRLELGENTRRHSVDTTLLRNQIKSQEAEIQELCQTNSEVSKAELKKTNDLNRLRGEKQALVAEKAATENDRQLLEARFKELEAKHGAYVLENPRRAGELSQPVPHPVQPGAGRLTDSETAYLMGELSGLESQIMANEAKIQALERTVELQRLGTDNSTTSATPNAVGYAAPEQLPAGAGQGLSVEQLKYYHQNQVQQYQAEIRKDYQIINELRSEVESYKNLIAARADQLDTGSNTTAHFIDPHLTTQNAHPEMYYNPTVDPAFENLDFSYDTTMDPAFENLDLSYDTTIDPEILAEVMKQANSGNTFSQNAGEYDNTQGTTASLDQQMHDVESSETTDLHTQIHELSGRLAEREATIRSLQDPANTLDLQPRIELLEESVQREKKDNSQHLTTILRYADSEKELNRQISALKGELLEQNAQVDEVKSSSAQLQRELANTKHIHGESQKAIKLLQDQRRGDVDSASAEEGITEVQRQLAQKAVDCARAEERIVELQKQLVQKDVNSASAEERIIRLQRQLTQRDDDATDLREQISALRAQVKELKGTIITNDKSTERQKQLMQKGHEIDVQTLNTRITRLERDLQQKNDETAKLRVSLQEHKSEVEKRGKLEGQVSGLQQQLAQNNIELTELHQRSETDSARLRKFEELSTRHQEELMQRESDISSLENICQDLENEGEQRKEQISRLKQGLTQRGKELSDVQADRQGQVSRLEERLALSDKNLTDIRAMHQEYVNQDAAGRHQVLQTRISQLEQAVVETKDLETKCEDLRVKLDGFEKAATECARTSTATSSQADRTATHMSMTGFLYHLTIFALLYWFFAMLFPNTFDIGWLPWHNSRYLALGSSSDITFDSKRWLIANEFTRATVVALRNADLTAWTNGAWLGLSSERGLVLVWSAEKWLGVERGLWG